ncbi:signal peptidase I, partial [Candidatus Microgenomates bacterium]|nr:signal peptidase I [Candidatus Microgenomates bacterium]
MFHHIDVRPKKDKGNKVLSLAGKIFEWGIFAVIITAFFVVASPILPTKNFISTYIVTSGSMEPKVLAGSVALVRPAEGKDLKIGDVIAFTSPQDANQTILHRISQLADGAIRTKGDNNNTADSWTIYPSSVKGRMIFTVPYIGQTAALMRTPVGFGLMMGLPVFLFMVFMFKQIKEGF